MGIFGQVQQGSSNGVCENVAVVSRKAKQKLCDKTPRVNKDCRPVLEVDCDLKLFRVSDCGETERPECDAENVLKWVCQDCCPTSRAEVQAIWGESFTVPTGYYAHLADGRKVKVDLSVSPPTVTEVACIPAADAECITCVTTGAVATTEEVRYFPHKPFVSPADYTIEIIPPPCQLG